MSAGLSDPLSAERQEVERRLLARRAGRSRRQIPRHDRGITPPLSFGQERMWLFARLYPDSTAGNFAFSYRLVGELDIEALRRALETIQARHEILRTVISEHGQVIRDPDRLGLGEHDFTGDDAGADAFVREVVAAPFELDRLPPIRWYLLHRGPGKHELVMSLHHIASDGWSESVIDRELATLYRSYHRGEPDPLPPLAVQYADYAAWQRGLYGSGSRADLDWWAQHLAGAPASVDLPADRPAGAMTSFDGAHLTRYFPRRIAGLLLALCEQESATMFMGLLAALAALLARFGGQDEVVIGAPAAGRSVPELERLIGLFINTIPVRVDTSGEPGLRELMRRVRAATLAAYRHQDVPLEQIVERLAPARQPGRQPLVQVMFQVYNVPEYRLELPGLRVTRTQLLSAGGSALDLTLSVAERVDDRGLGALWEYRAALFDQATVHRLHDCLEWLLDQAVAEPDRPLASIPLVTPAGQPAATGRSGRSSPRTGTAPEVTPAPVHRQIADRAAAVPDRLAVAGPDRSLSYAELRAQAAALAACLASAGIGRGDLVGIYADRSAEMVIAVLGVLNAGAAYLPLDPGHPPGRLEAIVSDARPALVLADTARAGTWPGGRVPMMSIGPLPAQESGADAGGPSHQVSPLDLAYVIYTSGSTGAPKGVAVSHGALASYLASCRLLLDQDGSLDWMLSSPLAFDFTVTPLFMPLISGRTVEMAGTGDRLDDLHRALTRPGRPAFAVKLTPAHMAALRDRLGADAVLDNAALLVVGGDQLLAEEAMAWQRLAPAARIVNEYGPTEVTVGCVTHQAGHDPLGRAAVPIGRASPGIRAYVLDRYLHPLPAGAIGELYLAGRGVARGYLGRPALTAAAFVPDPHGGEPGAVMYRTGDLARLRSDGLLEFTGRADRQIKIRGYRVELAEVEAALLACPGIAGAVVAARHDGSGEPWLAAYVVPAPGAAPPGPASLAARLRETLPPYLVPAAFVPLAELPLSANGKVDPARLPQPGRDTRPASAGYRVPAAGAEQAIAAIWRSALNIDRVGADDDFFMLGGHSVLASTVAGQVARALGADPAAALRALFRWPTVAGLAQALGPDAAQQPQRAAAARPRPRRDGPLPLTPAQEGLWFLDRLTPDSCEYLVPMAWWLDGPLDLAALQTALTSVAERHEVLRMSFAERDGRPVALLASPDVLRLAVRDLADADELLLEEATTPIDLAVAPPMRAVVGRSGAGRHLLCLTVHHIVFDGWSQAVLLNDLAVAYQAALAGSPPPWQPLACGYADYAARLREPDQVRERQDRLEHYARLLRDAPPLELPTDRPRPPHRLGHGDAIAFTVDPSLAAAVEELGRAHGATTLMVLTAALQAFLHRWTRATDITLGTSAGDRFDPVTHDLIGFFVNMLALRCDLSGDPEFGELIDRTRATALDAYAHQDVPFAEIVERLGGAPDLSRTPLFGVAIDYEAQAPALPRLGAALMTPSHVPPTMAKYDMGLTFRRDRDRLVCELEFDTGLFDTDTARRIGTAFETLLADAVRHPGARLSELAAPVSGLGRIWPRQQDPAGQALPAEPPSTDAERAIARIWEDVLQVSGLGRYDGFFTRGGRSLLAVRVIALMREAFGTALPLDLMFKYPTVAQAAAEVERILLAEIEQMSEEAAAELLRAPDDERTH